MDKLTHPMRGDNPKSGIAPHSRYRKAYDFLLFH
jgi:hypothetical protein